MTHFNKVILVGNLTRDPEVRYTAHGTAVTTFGLAITHRYRQGDELKEETCFVDCVTFGRQAETVGEYLQKGRPALVEGRLRWQSWETDEGQRRSKHTVLAERVQFLSSPARVRQEERETAEMSDPSPDTDDIPF
jgi:single-strand DNA-binding protein